MSKRKARRSIRPSAQAASVVPFSQGMSCVLAAAAGGVSFLALETDAAVAYNAALGVMANKTIGKALATAENYTLKINSTAVASKAAFKFKWFTNKRYVLLNNTTNIAILNNYPFQTIIQRKANGDLINAAQTRWKINFGYLNGAKGSFNNLTGYIGIRFTAVIKGGGNGTHYGWIKYTGGNNNKTGTIHSYAYKVVVNTAIKAAGPQAALASTETGALSWTARSEEGVARYDIERQSAGGEWEPAETILPGKGEYRVDGLGAAPCRVLAIGVDGSRSILGE